MRYPSRLKQSALIAALASIYPMHVFANAGIAQFSVGDVSVQRAAATTPLANGSRIESGDVITTGANGRTQMRFTDGGMVSLQSNSQFKINRYSDAAANQPDSFLVDLARGGMRAITGLIGKRNRDNYKVTTTTATIGIRGSGFSMAYNADGTLAVTTELDAIEVCTQAGCIGLNVGESALVTGANVRPTRTRERAAWNPPSPRRLATARSEDVDSKGRTSVIRLASSIAFSGVGFPVRSMQETSDVSESSSSTFQVTYLDGTIAGDPTIPTVIGYRAVNNDQVSEGTATLSYHTGTSAGGDLLLLGTWDNAAWTGTTNTTLSQMAFVAGSPTPTSAFSAATGLRGVYNMTKATPVYSSYSGATGILESGSVTVDFRSAFGAMDIDLNVMMSNNLMCNAEYSCRTDYYRLRGSGTALHRDSAGFSAALSVEENNDGSYFKGTGSAQGFFSGPTGNNLGLTYSGETIRYGTIGGAAAFTRGDQASAIPSTTIQPTGSSFSPMQVHALDGSGLFSAHAVVVQEEEYLSLAGVSNPEIPIGPVTTNTGNNIYLASPGCCSSDAASAVFSGTQLLSWQSGSIAYNQGNIGASPVPSGATVLQYGAYGQPNESNFLGWGAWQSGLTQNAGISSGSTQDLTAVHYIVGKPTYQSGGWQGSATYNFIGGTNPTATNMSTGSTVVGSILPKSNLHIDFGSTPIVSANLFLSFNGAPVEIIQTGTVLGNKGSSGQIVSTGPIASGQFSGILSGTKAERAGIVYGIQHSLGNIRGAAAFQTSTPPSSYYD
jgi:FecR protein